MGTSHETKYILKSRLSNRVEARNKTPSSKGAPAPPALVCPPPPENSEMKLLPNGCGLTGASGSGVVVPSEEEEELASSPEEGASAASHPPTVPKTFAAAFTTAAVLVPTRFVRGRTAVPAGAISEEEG